MSPVETKKPLITISTKTGDTGTTGLANGQRLPKTAPVFGVIGALDELNSWLGLVIAKLQAVPPLVIDQPTLATQLSLLTQTQTWLYQVSAVVAAAPHFSITLTIVTPLETQTTDLQTQLAPDWHHHFLYPGGSELGGWLDVARTVARRTERDLLTWQESQPQTLRLDATTLATLNRLSDYLYMLRCWTNFQLAVPEKEFHRD